MVYGYCHTVIRIKRSLRVLHGMGHGMIPAPFPEKGAHKPKYLRSLAILDRHPFPQRANVRGAALDLRIAHVRQAFVSIAEHLRQPLECACILVAAEKLLQCGLKPRCLRRGAGKQGHRRVKLEMIRIAEHLLDRAALNGIHQFGAGSKARA
jgi:hypothetical protein